MDNIVPETNADLNNTNNIINDTDSIAVNEDEIVNYYNKTSQEAELLATEINDLTNTYNNINTLMYKNQQLLDDENVDDDTITIIHESYLSLAKETPLANHTYDAWDICMESNLPSSNKLVRVMDNIVAFLKRLYKFIMEKINQMVNLFKNARYKATTIIGKILIRGSNVLELLKTIQNKDRELFEKSFKGETLQEAMKNYIEPTPVFYMGANTLNQVINVTGFFKELNRNTTELVKCLSNAILDATTNIKDGVYKTTFLNEMYNDIVKIKPTQDVEDGKQYVNIVEILNKGKYTEKDTKKVLPLLLDKDCLTFTIANKPNDNNGVEILFCNSISPSLNNTIEYPDSLSFNDLNKLCNFGLHSIKERLLENRDTIYNLLTDFQDLIDLSNSILKSGKVGNPEGLKDLTIAINKNIYPTIYRMLMKQYIAMILLYNNRLGYIETLIKTMNENKNN